MSRNASSVGDCPRGTTMKKTLTCLLAAATIAAALAATAMDAPLSGGDGDGVAVGTAGDGGVADGDRGLQRGSSAVP